VAPGAQTPVHVPWAQTYGQAVPAPQFPPELQVSTSLPLHCVEPGVHVPVQAPETQALLAHGWVLVHVPVASHVSTALPAHLVDPGVQTPVQVPPTQA
jgi:hypothetical protein